MPVNGELRDANKKLLERLKQSQAEITRLIVAAKHSDPRLMPSAPLTSTVAHRNTGGDALKRSGRLLTHARNVLTKSPGILKTKNKQPKKVRLPTPIIKSPARSGPTSPKYEIISNFLKSQSDKGKNLTFSETPNENPRLTDPGNSRPYKAPEQTARPKSVLVQTGNEQITDRNETSAIRNSAKTPQRQIISAEPPLLGYDWIAGVIENEDPSTEHSESFLEEIKEFRKLNRSDCQSKRTFNDMLKTPKTPLQELSPRLKLQKATTGSPDPSDTRDPRIVNYTINKRLFPVPVDPNDCGRPGTSASPRYIRVSIPKASLISPYRYRPKHGSKLHDGADSLSLPDHCTLGWHNTVPKRSAKSEEEACLDLRSSIRPKENLTSLQLKSGQANLRGGVAASPPSESFLDRSYAIQYKLRKLKSGL